MRKDIDADLQLYIPEKLNEDLPVVIVNIDKAEDNEAIHEAVTELLDKDFILSKSKAGTTTCLPGLMTGCLKAVPRLPERPMPTSTA